MKRSKEDIISLIQYLARHTKTVKDLEQHILDGYMSIDLNDIRNWSYELKLQLESEGKEKV